MSSANQKKLEGYTVANIAAARVISSDPVKYPAGSLLAEWAASVLQRAEKPLTIAERVQLSFKTEGDTQAGELEGGQLRGGGPAQEEALGRPVTPAGRCRSAAGEFLPTYQIWPARARRNGGA